MHLSLTEIRQRLQNLRNYERLNSEKNTRIKKILEENKVLREENSQLKQQVETAFIRIGELEKMIFGRKKQRKDDDNNDSGDTSLNVKKEVQPRSASSYQRPLPKQEEITNEEHLSVGGCKHCGGKLTRIEEVVRYIEDILLPKLVRQIAKSVTKRTIEKGYCSKCGVWTAAEDLRGQAVSLGKHVRLLVCYLVTILDCSYTQVKALFNDQYDIKLSDGEIVSILEEQALNWHPEYERLKEEIRGSPAVHLDETTWPIQQYAKHTYAWVMSSVNTLARVYVLASSRGKGYAEELLKGYVGVRITDCYPAYKLLKGLHQICWAHLYRKINDLLTNDNLPKDKLPHIQAWHTEFKQVYADLRSFIAEPFNQERREQQTTELRTKIETLRKPDPKDPKKLRDLKNLITEYDHALFTCMKFEGIPCDNNRAERDIRTLVIKRKKSFGCRTDKGARTMEVLLSVCFSMWHQHRSDFLLRLSRLGTELP